MSYDPSIAKWTTEDPAGYVDGPNLYQTEESNPVSRVDPTGLFASRGPNSPHATITRNGLVNSGLPSRMIDTIIRGNVGQDAGSILNRPPFSDPTNHGDNGPANIKATIDKIFTRWRGMLDNRNTCPNCQAVDNLLFQFGQVLHAIQDLYSHTNYVELMDQAAGGLSTPGTIPLWDFSQRDANGPILPDGIISGNYQWPGDNAPNPSHRMLAKDDPTFPESQVINNAGFSYFDLASDLATRATTQAWDEFQRQLYGSPAWTMLQKCAKLNPGTQPSTIPSGELMRPNP